jgi:prepilin-type N-terminal cleavage/methylation domain-containing protein
MRHARPHRFAASSGFTLIESIIVVVLLSLAAAAIISMQGNIFYGQSGNRDLEVGVQLMQECAEQVMAMRRQSGYAAVDASTCNAVGTLSGSGFDAPSVTVTTEVGVGAVGEACPNGSTCTKVVISVNKTGGASLTPVTLELVSY